jgi:hypothetical protein
VNDVERLIIERLPTAHDARRPSTSARARANAHSLVAIVIAPRCPSQSRAGIPMAAIKET